MTDEDLPTGFLDRIVDALREVPGVAAIVLGGSRARGSAHEDSDVDLGLYFAAERPIDVQKLDALAARLDERQSSGLVTRIGEWGPWIVGGGWLKIEGRAVDLLYRELGHVERVLRVCREGEFACDYQVGHPHGFPSTIYAAEVAMCRPLWDPRGHLEHLKPLVVPYPPAMSRELIRRFGWEAQFSIDVGRKGLVRVDVHYVAGCVFRAVACLVQVLFALNEQHLLNEKGSLMQVSELPRYPERFVERVNFIYTRLQGKPETLASGLDSLELLKHEVDGLIASSAGH